MTNHKRVVKNTGFLFFRLIIVTLISLYTSRVLLDELGIEDFGLYGLIGGIVAMFSSLRGLFASSIQRFLNFEIGKENDIGELKKIFSFGVTIQLVLAVILVIICECVGLWLIHNKLVIEPDKINAALWVFHLSIMSAVVIMMTIPYDAVLIARERMNIFAYLSILESVLKLGIIFLLPYFGEKKLIVYAILIFLVSLIIRLINLLYCKSHFKECTYRFIKDKSLFKELSRFAGWNFLGNSTYSLVNEGTNILLNMFGGTAVNAARSIAYQVRSTITNFTANIQISSNPQIVQLYAQDKKIDSFNLALTSSKFSFFLSLLIVLPLITYTNEVLNIWLKEVPIHTVNFVRLILLSLLVRVFSIALDSLFVASGKLKTYQIINSIANLFNLPLSYFFLKQGYSVEIVFFIMIFMMIIYIPILLILSKKIINLPLKLYFKKVILPSIVVSSLSFITVFFLFYGKQTEGYLQLTMNVAIILIICCVYILIFGLTKRERIRIKNYISAIVLKMNKLR